MHQTSPRKKRLIRPRLQLSSALVFLGTASLYVLLQAYLLWRAVDRQGAAIDSELAAELVSILRLNLLATIVVLIPLTLVVSVFTTHKIAGPIHRFESYLEQLLQGERPGPCKIRKGDELQYLCELLNEATAPVRDGAFAPASLARGERSSDLEPARTRG
jgi:hypothetical protein